jgi:phosphoglucosamine mutase
MSRPMRVEELAELLAPRLGAIREAAGRGVYAVAPLARGGPLGDPEWASRNASALDADDAAPIAAFIDSGGLSLGLAGRTAVVDVSRAAAVLRADGRASGGEALARAASLARVGFMGTDGMRGAVDAAGGGDCVSAFFGSARLGPELVRIAARAYGRMMIDESLAREGDQAAIAEDGRDAAWDGVLKAALIEGLAEAGLSILDLGVIPTPYVPWAMLRRGLACGAMLTASHNPANQNGVKFFREGRKLLPEGRAGDLELSGRMYREYLEGAGRAGGERPHSASSARVATERVDEEAAAFVASALPAGAAGRLRGLRVAADAAAGAGHELLAGVFAALGVDGTVASPEPAGSNINLRCGVAEIEGRERYAAADEADAPAVVRELFARGRARRSPEWGMALDGDADRGFVLLYDPGRDEVAVLNGDKEGALLAMRAVAAPSGARPPGDFAASMESDPMCAHFAREVLGLRTSVVSVGDKWLGAYSKGPLLVGVEPSGHVVVPISVLGPGGSRRELRAGNGILTCLAAIDAALELGLSPAKAAEPYDPGFCRAFYTYFVSKQRFFPGSTAWEASAEAMRSAFCAQVALGALPEGTILAFEDMEDPFTLYASFRRRGEREAAAFCRNSGTEDKIAAYVQCPRPWSPAFEEIGRAVADAHAELMRDALRPEFRAAEAIVNALRDRGSAGIAEDELAEAAGEAAGALAPSALRAVLACLVKEGRAAIRDGRAREAPRARPEPARP